jgi:negative regulator of sigma E activity
MSETVAEATTMSVVLAVDVLVSMAAGDDAEAVDDVDASVLTTGPFAGVADDMSAVATAVAVAVDGTVSATVVSVAAGADGAAT